MVPKTLFKKMKCKKTRNALIVLSIFFLVIAVWTETLWYPTAPFAKRLFQNVKAGILRIESPYPNALFQSDLWNQGDGGTLPQRAQVRSTVRRVTDENSDKLLWRLTALKPREKLELLNNCFVLKFHISPVRSYLTLAYPDISEVNFVESGQDGEYAYVEYELDLTKDHLKTLFRNPHTYATSYTLVLFTLDQDRMTYYHKLYLYPEGESPPSAKRFEEIRDQYYRCLDDILRRKHFEPELPGEGSSISTWNDLYELWIGERESHIFEGNQIVEDKILTFDTNQKFLKEFSDVPDLKSEIFYHNFGGEPHMRWTLYNESYPSADKRFQHIPFAGMVYVDEQHLAYNALFTSVHLNSDAIAPKFPTETHYAVQSDINLKRQYYVPRRDGFGINLKDNECLPPKNSDSASADEISNGGTYYLFGIMHNSRFFLQKLDFEDLEKILKKQ